MAAAKDESTVILSAATPMIREPAPNEQAEINGKIVPAASLSVKSTVNAVSATAEAPSWTSRFPVVANAEVVTIPATPAGEPDAARVVLVGAT